MSILIAVFLFAGIAAKAQMPDFHISLFDEKDGIHASKIVDMVRDDRGFLWLLHSRQVCRFDGKNVNCFLLDNRLISIAKDRNNQIWAVSMSRLYRFENDVLGFQPVEVDTTLQPQLIAMLKLPEKGLRLLTNRGFYSFDNKEKKFVPNHILDTPINGGEFIYTHSYGLSGNNFFYATNDSIVSLNLKTGKSKSLYVYDLYRFYPIDKNSVIASNWKGQSYVYDFSNLSITPLHSPGAEDTRKSFLGVVGFCKLKDQYSLLASYDNEISKYDISNKSLKHINLFYRGKPFSNFKTLALYRDDDQNIWIATNTGLLFFNAEKPRIGLLRNWEKSPDKAFSDQVRNFSPDKKGNLWLATSNGFAYFDLNTGEVKSFIATPGAQDKLNHNSIRGIVDDGQNLIIGQSNRGIWLYNPETQTYKRPPNTPIADKDDFIDMIYPLQNGNHVVIGREKVYLINGKTYHIQPVDYPGKNNNPVFCFQDRQHRIWIGAGNQLYCFDENMKFQFASQAFKNLPLSLCQTGENEFYVAANGLFPLTLEEQNIKVHEQVKGLEGLTIRIVYQDSLGKLWLGADEGIYSYSLSDKTSQSDSGKIEHYDFYDNVQTGRFYINSFYRFPNGPIFMGGISGMNYFYPEKLKNHEDSLIVSILQVSVNEKPLPTKFPLSVNSKKRTQHTKREFQLHHNQKNIEISFSAPYFDNPTRVEYRYRMKGAGEDWVNIKNTNSIRFASLAPGEYVFDVSASVNGRDWYKSSPLYFSIQPPFWQMWWFFALLGILGIGLLYLWIRHLRRRLHEEEIITRFATSLFSQNTMDKTFWDVAKNCISILGLEDCVIYYFDHTKNKLIQKAAAGPKGNPNAYKVYDAIEIPIGKGIVGAAAQSQKTQIVKDLRKDSRYIVDDKKRLSEIAVPIIVDGKIFGVIDSEHSRKNYFTKWHSRLLEKIANLCAEKISRYLLAEEVRIKIAQDLHDDMGSTLTSINIISNIAMKQKESEKVSNHLEKIKDNSEKMMESLNDIIWAINPAHDTLDQIGIHMKEYTAELLDPTDISYSFEMGKDIEKTKFELSKRKDLFLIFKEALNNALKYSRATKIEMVLKRKNEYIILGVKDNGKGFNPSEVLRGNGLRNMKHRAENSGGFLQIESQKGKGTSLQLKIPIT